MIHLANTGKNALLCILLASTFISACKSNQSSNGSLEASNASAGPEIDSSVGESLWPKEKESSRSIADEIEKTIRRDYAGKRALRDAHPKSHGCVKADFAVNDNLSGDLAQGVFVPGKHYTAWIRFSNGNSDASKPDTDGDARGMAIKLTDVAGAKILPEESTASTQDFVMISHPVFFASDPVSYLLLIQRVSSTNVLSRLAAPLALGFNGAMIAREIQSKKIGSPLETRYWSEVPYRMGAAPSTNVMKFSAKPCFDTQSPIPSNAGPNFLRAKMADQLASGIGCFEFLVQLRTKPSIQPVEDPMVEWKESDSQFTKVAQITINKQVFNTAKQNEFCDNLSFTPWHAVAAHRPLGAVNRTRRIVYSTVSTVRHEMNGAPRQEPTGKETF